MVALLDASSNVGSDSSKPVSEKISKFEEEVQGIKVDGSDAPADDVTVKIEELRQDAVEEANKWTTDYEGNFTLWGSYLTSISTRYIYM